mmetsp:Transcript_15870/g.62000  ORF Transcript_15870/g.62000 Transcript_15870/m.62000 type:complete len:256 (+) Transcript_15870:741-1508(+)
MPPRRAVPSLLQQGGAPFQLRRRPHQAPQGTHLSRGARTPAGRAHRRPAADVFAATPHPGAGPAQGGRRAPRGAGGRQGGGDGPGRGPQEPAVVRDDAAAGVQEVQRAGARRVRRQRRVCRSARQGMQALHERQCRVQGRRLLQEPRAPRPPCRQAPEEVLQAGRGGGHGGPHDRHYDNFQVHRGEGRVHDVLLEGACKAADPGHLCVGGPGGQHDQQAEECVRLRVHVQAPADVHGHDGEQRSRGGVQGEELCV